jgi:uncharacterized membrane protein YbaN (DUF454 family)
MNGVTASRCGLRYLLIGFGWFNVALGAIGVVVPGMPTTVFLLIALWAFSKSSERFRTWLYDHPRFGPPIRDWHEHGVISVRAKTAALAMMGLSLVIMAAAGPWQLPAITGAIMVPISIFIVSRPSRPSEMARQVS